MCVCVCVCRLHTNERNSPAHWPWFMHSRLNALQRLRADSVDAAAATNTSIIMSPTSGAGQGEDPAARGRKNRDRERAKREAKRKAATAAAAAIGRSGEDPAFAGAVHKCRGRRRKGSRGWSGSSYDDLGHARITFLHIAFWPRWRRWRLARTDRSVKKPPAARSNITISRPWQPAQSRRSRPAVCFDPHTCRRKCI